MLFLQGSITVPQIDIKLFLDSFDITFSKDVACSDFKRTKIIFTYADVELYNTLNCTMEKGVARFATINNTDLVINILELE